MQHTERMIDAVIQSCKSDEMVQEHASEEVSLILTRRRLFDEKNSINIVRVSRPGCSQLNAQWIWSSPLI
jgi:hypothetical protein